MPNKHNDDRHYHILKMSFKVQNWPEYEVGLRRRGSRTLWIDNAVLDRWQSVGPLGQARYLNIVFCRINPSKHNTSVALNDLQLMMQNGKD